jgi:hypothetical protein
VLQDWDREKKDLRLEEFSRNDTIASLDKGQPEKDN